MVVRVTVFAVNLLSPHHISCDAVSMALSVFTLANLDNFRVDPQKLQILYLVYEISFKVFQKRRQELIRQP